jgi:hypothetical protein
METVVILRNKLTGKALARFRVYFETEEKGKVRDLEISVNLLETYIEWEEEDENRRDSASIG